MEKMEIKTGPNGWMAALIVGIFSAAALIIALAAWHLVVYLGTALILFTTGAGLRLACFGIAAIVREHHAGQAQIIRAQGAAIADIRRARTLSAAGRRYLPTQTTDNQRFGSY